MRVQNDAGLLFTRKGIFEGKVYTFTHRDPKTGDVWCEDILWGFGCWVPNERVKWL